jgi:large subunit ribosomal protein L21
MYAIIEAGNVQFRIEEGDTLRIPRVKTEAGEKLTLDKVLVVGDGDNTKIGTPYVDGVSVTAEVMGEVMGDKVQVFKMKRRTTYRRKTGHRERFTEVRVEKIDVS